MHDHADHEHLDDLTILKAFHGHLGPYVVAGLRLGRYALRRLAADPHFGIEAEVECPDAPPPSCVLDGIQFSTGCTLGKRNITHRVAEGVTAHFRNRATGERLTVRLRPDSLARAVAVLKAESDVAGAAVIEGLSDEELLEELPQG